jgi:hypothetical protein
MLDAVGVTGIVDIMPIIAQAASFVDDEFGR